MISPALEIGLWFISEKLIFKAGVGYGDGMEGNIIVGR